jgi:hypothetical protein
MKSSILVEKQMIFRKSISPPSSGSRNKSEARKRHEADSKPFYLVYAGFLLGFFLKPEDRGDMLLRNVS